MTPFNFDTQDVLCLRKPLARAAQPQSTLRGADWAKQGSASVARLHHHLATSSSWYIECHLQGVQALSHCVEIDPQKRGGVPVLRGTRFTIAQVLAELADTDGVDQVAESYELEADLIREVLEGMSLLMQKPFAHK